MPILNVDINQVGQAGVFPAIIYILTNDTLDTINTTGYLNPIPHVFGVPLNEADVAFVTTKTSPSSSSTQVGLFGVVQSGGNWSLTMLSGSSSIILPTTADHIATYNDTMGTLTEDPATALTDGNLTASGDITSSEGNIISTQGNITASEGNITASGNITSTEGNITSTIGNIVATEGSVTAQDDITSTQGNITSTEGNITAPGGNITAQGDIVSTEAGITAIQGNITAGSNGQGGTFISYPGGSNSGTLVIAAANADAAHNTTISNGVMGQSTVYTLGDIGASTGGIVVATSTIGMKSVAGASVAGGGAAQTITDAFCTTSSNVIGNWNTHANAVTVQKIVPGNGSFVVTSSGDPGSSTFNYIIIN